MLKILVILASWGHSEEVKNWVMGKDDSPGFLYAQDCDKYNRFLKQGDKVAAGRYLRQKKTKQEARMFGGHVRIFVSRWIGADFVLIRLPGETDEYWTAAGNIAIGR